MAEYVFGEIAGHPIGSSYRNRPAAAAARVHQLTMQGIAGNRHEGCVSIVLNGGYDTDEDYGDRIVYTGAGGQDPGRRNVHIADQDLAYSPNAALVRSVETSKPIRIIRGSKGEAAFSPAAGFRYDGLFRAVAYWQHDGDDGWRRWLFDLVQLSADEAAAFTPAENLAASQAAQAAQVAAPEPAGLTEAGPQLTFGEPVVVPPGNETPRSMVVVSVRVVRDTAVAAKVKSFYDSACQVCGIQLAISSGWYVEGAHIRPLGLPHRGPDTVANVLSLCPNHHALFDKGGLYLDDNLRVLNKNHVVVGDLAVHRAHQIDLNQIRYHRAHHGFPGAAD